MEALVSKASLICCRSTPAPATTSAPLFYLRAIIAGHACGRPAPADANAEHQ
jgi:hypothetical protein